MYIGYILPLKGPYVTAGERQITPDVELIMT